MRILVTDGMDKTAMAQLREAGHEVVEQFYSPEELGAALREFDKQQVAYIYSEGFSENQVGQAVMNRLIKAAGHTIINV